MDVEYAIVSSRSVLRVRPLHAAAGTKARVGEGARFAALATSMLRAGEGARLLAARGAMPAGEGARLQVSIMQNFRQNFETLRV